MTGQGELESALARPNHTWYGKWLYPTALHRAGALLHGLVHAHAFYDGNKRTAWVTTANYIKQSGGSLVSIAPDLVVDFMVAVADHTFDEKDAALWLAEWLAR